MKFEAASFQQLFWDFRFQLMHANYQKDVNRELLKNDALERGKALGVSPKELDLLWTCYWENIDQTDQIREETLSAVSENHDLRAISYFLRGTLHLSYKGSFSERNLVIPYLSIALQVETDPNTPTIPIARILISNALALGCMYNQRPHEAVAHSRRAVAFARDLKDAPLLLEMTTLNLAVMLRDRNDTDATDEAHRLLKSMTDASQLYPYSNLRLSELEMWQGNWSGAYEILRDIQSAHFANFLEQADFCATLYIITYYLKLPSSKVSRYAEDALSYLEEARRKNLDQAGDFYFKTKMAAVKILKSDKNHRENDYFDQAILKLLKKTILHDRDKYADYMRASKTAFQSHSQERDSAGSLHILRNWSSAVPLIFTHKVTEWRGGGYFIKWRGKGIVIDPGHDFLHNFHDAGFRVSEIDVVLITHEHPDHCGNANALNDLIYECHQRAPLDEKETWKYSLITTEQTAHTLGLDFSEEKSHVSYIKVSDREGLRDVHANHDDHFTIRSFIVQHGETRLPVGFQITLKGENDDRRTIAYSGDTIYFPELGKYLKGSDVVILHASEPSPTEFMQRECSKSNHLGFNGTRAVVDSLKYEGGACQPPLFLIGEFWGGREDIRIEFVELLKLMTEYKAILPASIRLNVDLNDFAPKVECTQCLELASPENLEVLPPKTPGGPLIYWCGCPEEKRRDPSTRGKMVDLAGSN